MIPVDQTLFGVPGGNCFAACVASILELDINDVPYFMEDEQWKPRFNHWIWRNYLIVPSYFSLTRYGWYPSDIHILHGKSPRGNHCVVARGSKIIHDPHPSRKGLISIREATVLHLRER